LKGNDKAHDKHTHVEGNFVIGGKDREKDRLMKLPVMPLILVRDMSPELQIPLDRPITKVQNYKSSKIKTIDNVCLTRRNLQRPTVSVMYVMLWKKYFQAT
jgi:hypothetical protein